LCHALLEAIETMPTNIIRLETLAWQQTSSDLKQWRQAINTAAQYYYIADIIDHPSDSCQVERLNIIQ